MKTSTKVVLWLLASPFLALAWLLAMGAIYYSNLPWAPVRHGLAWAFVAAGPLALLLLKRRRRTLAWMAVAWTGVLIWHLSIPASNERVWRVETAALPDATFDGDLVTVTNIRNFDYRTEDDFDVRYYDKTFDLTRLEAVDLIVSYWEGEAIAHTLVSFDFGGRDVLCLSVEVRKEEGEEYAVLPGIFKRFEIIYVLADERDVIRLRTNYRREDVYLFRSQFSPAEARLFLTRILEKVHELNSEPEFYRTIANNCTTSLVGHVNEVWPNRTAYTKKVLMNGYLPEHAFERGTLASDLPFEEYKRSCNISAAGLAADEDPDFSRRIRAHLRDE